ncbi:MAG: HAMP domain-containing protein [Burkholderiales bacterium]|nr:HAMP domain-containing protein [Opitutaceae bacterium]
MVQELEASGHYILYRATDGSNDYTSAGAPEIQPIDRKLAANQNRGTMVGRWNGPNRELISFSPRGEVVLLGLHETRIAADLRAFVVRLALLGAGVIAAGLLGGYFIANRAIRPIRAIGDSARRIADGNWDERIPPGQAPVEVEQLRGVLNASFDRIAAAYDQQRRFTADASHELGTPVAIVLAQTQHALSRPRSPEEYVAALAACRRAGERMKALSRDLLDLAAYDAHTTAPRRVECDLAELARESLALVAPAVQSRQAVLVEHLEAVPARVDPLGLSQILVNLLNNALVHNAPGVRITVSVRREGEDAVLTVADNGRGIPPAALPNIFERFYRADSARGRDAGGSGLGLAIAHRIAVLHEGEIAASNPPEGGACFTLRLPTHPAAR